MTITRVGALAILFLMLVAADSRQITKHYDFYGDRVSFSSLKNMTLLYATWTPGIMDEQGGNTTVIMEDYSFNNSTNKATCPIVYHSYVESTKIVDIGKGHVLVIWINGKIETERFINLMNIRLKDCRSTSTIVIPVPPKKYFPFYSPYFLNVIPYESTYDVLITGCLDNYTKACKITYDFDGNIVEKFGLLNQIDECTTNNSCRALVKSKSPEDGFIFVRHFNENSTMYLTTEAKTKILKVWTPPLEEFVHATYDKDNIIACVKFESVLNCSIFDREGVLKHDISMDDNTNWDDLLKLHILPNGFLVSFRVSTNVPNEYGIPEWNVSTYLRRYDFEGNLVKELLVDSGIPSRRNFGNDLFEYDDGEYCISLFGSPSGKYSGSFNYIIRCYKDL